MAGEFDIRGLEQLDHLSHNLREAANKDLERELSQAFSKVARPIVRDVRLHARTDLPKHGGLAADVGGSKINVRKNVSGRGAGVGLRIVMSNPYALVMIDKGSVRHPVPNSSAWVTQTKGIVPGFWSRPTKAAEPEARREAIAALEIVARKIGRGV